MENASPIMLSAASRPSCALSIWTTSSSPMTCRRSTSIARTASSASAANMASPCPAAMTEPNGSPGTAVASAHQLRAFARFAAFLSSPLPQEALRAPPYMQLRRRTSMNPYSGKTHISFQRRRGASTLTTAQLSEQYPRPRSSRPSGRCKCPHPCFLQSDTPWSIMTTGAPLQWPTIFASGPTWRRTAQRSFWSPIQTICCNTPGSSPTMSFAPKTPSSDQGPTPQSWEGSMPGPSMPPVLAKPWCSPRTNAWTISSIPCPRIPTR